MTDARSSTVIPAALAGERSDRAVSLLVGCSRADAARLIVAGSIRRNGKTVAKGSERLAEGDLLDIDATGLGGEHGLEPDRSVDLAVVHEDDSLIVVDKPAGLVVHPGAGHVAPTLAGGLLARYPEIGDVGEPFRPGIVHRLDKETSGLLVVARTEPARAALAAQLADRSMSRQYLAVVWGHPDADKGVIDAPIGRSRRQPTRRAVVVDGREARTHYEVVHRYRVPAMMAQLICRLETGRTHQIRVHLDAIGHPVVGDSMYRGVRGGFEAPRLALHAYHLELTHPDDQRRVSFDSPVPEDLAGFLAAVR